VRKPFYKLPISQDLRFLADSTVSRLLLSCTLVLILVMPWTEYFWHFDKFLRGGQDFELSLLSLLAVLCLMLVLFQQGKKNVELVLIRGRRLALPFRSRYTAKMPGSHSGLIAPLHAVPLPSPMLGKYNLPIRV
jgi:hypothetical protein